MNAAEHIDSAKAAIARGKTQDATAHALIAIAEQGQPVELPAATAKCDHIVLSIGGKSREDIPVTVTAVHGLTSYRFELDLGALGHQTVLLDLFHREADL